MPVGFCGEVSLTKRDEQRIKLMLNLSKKFDDVHRQIHKIIRVQRVLVGRLKFNEWLKHLNTIQEYICLTQLSERINNINVKVKSKLGILKRDPCDDVANTPKCSQCFLRADDGLRKEKLICQLGRLQEKNPVLLDLLDAKK